MRLKTLLILIFLLITVLVITYIDYGIKHFGLSFHTGKDSGYFMRFESVVILSTIFYSLQLIHTRKKFSEYLLVVLTGFLTGIFVGIACYLLPFDNGLVYHILSIAICYSSFYGYRKVYRMTTKKASAE